MEIEYEKVSKKTLALYKSRQKHLHRLTEVLIEHIKPEFYQLFTEAVLKDRLEKSSDLSFFLIDRESKTFKKEFNDYIQKGQALEKQNNLILEVAKKQEKQAYESGCLSEYYKNLYNIYQPIESKVPLETLPWRPSCDLIGKNATLFDQIAGYLKCSDPVIVEAGAYDGQDSCIMKQKWPNSTQYAFEPMPLHHDKTQYNTKHLKQFHLHKTALYSKMLQLKVDTMHNTILNAAKIKSHEDNNANLVDFITLDSFLESNQIKQVDFLYLDTEGTEDHVLEGAKNALKQVKVIYIELNFFNKKGWAHFNKIDTMLRKNNFKLESIYNNCADYDSMKYYAKAQANGLYVKQDS